MSFTRLLRSTHPDRILNPNPSTYFKAGDEGFLLDVSVLSSLFKDDAATDPVTADGDAIAVLHDQSGNNTHGTQTTVGDRPVYKLAGNVAYLDNPGTEIYRDINVTIPAGGWTGTMIFASRAMGLIVDATLPAGTYSVAAERLYWPGGEPIMVMMIDRALTASETNKLQNYFTKIGAGSVPRTDWIDMWHGRSEITDFPLIDTSSVTRLYRSWRDCTGLTSFPLLNTSAVTDMAYAWRDCSGLTSLPLLDTSAVTTLNNTWSGCTGLTSFPLLNTSAVTNFANAWYGCSGLTSFPALDFSASTDMGSTWYNCSALASFPANSFDGCLATDFFWAFKNCALNQTSVDGILVSIDSNATSNGTLHIDGGTNATPSSSGQTAADALRARGWTVTLNGY